MAVKGIDIFKLSPKTNCKECGIATCMAFCMQVAQGKLDIHKCPHMSPEALALLEEATQPPMKTVEVGAGECAHKLGGETVLFRHEKTLVNHNLFAVKIAADDADFDAKLAKAVAIDYQRIGEREYIECVAIPGTDGAKLAEAAKKVVAAKRLPIICTTDAGAAKTAVEAVKDAKPILIGATAATLDEFNGIATAAGVTLGICSSDIAEIHEMLTKLEAAGNKNVIVNVTGPDIKSTFAAAVQMRRSAIKDDVKVLGYPSIIDLSALAPGCLHKQTALAAIFTLKYGSILVLEDKVTYAEMLALHGFRQNIYTDPQKPMTVEQKVYPLNGATPEDPALLTVDFALTYFLVSGEIERSKVPTNLIITDASGMSVLTAWAAGKMTSASIKKTFDELNLNETLKTRTVVIPGKVAVMQGDIQDKLPDWNVVVGTRESIEIVKYLKNGEHVKAAEAIAAKKK